MLGLVRLVEEYPQPQPRTILIVGLGAGLALGCRILGGCRADLCGDRLHAAAAVRGPDPGTSRSGAPVRSRRLRAHPRPAVRLSRHGLIWPWSIVKLDNPLQAMTYFSAFFERSRGRNCSTADGLRAGHAVVVPADPVRPETAGSHCGDAADGSSRRDSARCSAVTYRPSARRILTMLVLAATAAADGGDV